MTKSECQLIEYKESWRDEYLKWICGYANAQGGLLYIGVDDDKNVVGVEDEKQLLEDIPNKIVQSMGILVEVNLREQEGKTVIEIFTRPFEMPIAYKGKYYYRSGSTKQEMTGAALSQFLLEKMGTSWDDIYVNGSSIDCIDRKAIDYFLHTGIDNGRIAPSTIHDDTQTVLENLHLIGEDGRLKTAAILLFGKDPLKYFTCVRFRIGRFGVDEADLMFQDEIEGNIVQMADRVIEVLRSKYLRTPIHYEHMRRKEPLEIPEAGFREILYNAIVHKQYLGVDIQMHVYDDRVEVWNEGELPEGYTNEVLYQPHTSKPRNKNIAEAFYRMGAIESWGRGYRKISNEFAAAGMPLPITESKFGGVLVTIPRGQVTGQVRGQVTGQVRGQVTTTTEQVTEQVLAVLNLLMQEEMSIKRMMMELKFSSRDKFIENYLNPCTMAGYVSMTQPDSPNSPTQKYRLTEIGLKVLRALKDSIQ